VLLIGIDEAGYGPRLGPLCHGYCAFRCAQPAGSSAPDLWEALRSAITRHPAADDRLTVDDSKKVYSPPHGLDLLTRGVSGFLHCLDGGHGGAAEQNGLYARLLPEADRARLEEDPWAQDGDSAASVTPPAATSEPAVLRLRDTLAAQRVRVLALGARALSARHFNAALRARNNKADVNWSVIAPQLQALVPLAGPDEDAHIVVDRQGGRKFYGAQAAALFPGAMLWVERETPRASVYRLEPGGRRVRLEFLVEADAASMPVALASMAAKLARELCMARLNAFFRRHTPDLQPTAGYAADAGRFLKDTRALRERLGLDDGALIREK